jgi:uncharacterized protein (DUF2062 family)
LKNWLKRRVLEPLLVFLKQGMSPERLALCVAIAIVIGNIPILGVSSILCAVIALLFRLNLPAIQVVQWLMAPTQLLLIIPFVRLGEWLMRDPRQPITLKAATALLSQGIGPAVRGLWGAIVHAGVAWALLAPLTLYLIYKILTPLFRHAAQRMAREH